MNLREATTQVLDRAITFVAASPWKDHYLVRLERMRAQVSEPCVLAVAGRVKAGKSTLINALLGEDLAAVGVSETTATINYFRYGIPDDPERPVCCVWTNDRRTWESKAFVDRLQGTDSDTLQKAESISHLEFTLPLPYLKEITLVDTPGTDALVGENGQAHERVTGAFFGVRGAGQSEKADRARLGKRHDEETRRISGDADAVIYLVGQVAHVTNEAFLSEFQAASSGRTRALNAVGVMAKVDLQDEYLAQRHELAAAVAARLKQELNTVVPVSAALWRALGVLRSRPDRAARIKANLPRIPPERFERMLRDERAFLREYEDCPLTLQERQEMRSGMPWRVFVLIATALYQQEPDEAIRDLEQLSGFPRLRRLIDDHFFQRSRLLRCFRILSDVQEILDEIRNRRLYEYRQTLGAAKRELIEFTDFIIAHPDGNSETANRLRRYLERHVPTDEGARLEGGLGELTDKVEAVLDELEWINRQFQGLQLLDQAPPDQLSSEEIRELQHLFGLHADTVPQEGGIDAGHIGRRQIHWRQVMARSRYPWQKALAELAVRFYGQQLQRALQESAS